MKRRSFFRSAAGAGLAAGMTATRAAAHVPAHNWDKYDFGSGPAITDRLDQGPFPEYPPEQVFPGGSVVMATSPSEEVVPNFGRGLVTYVTANSGLDEILSDDKARAIEELVRLPLGQKVYLRPTWREIQKRRGRLDFPDYWKQTFQLAKQYNKRFGFRIQMSAPDYRGPALPDFIIDNVPMVKLIGEWKNSPTSARSRPEYAEPRCDHAYFRDAFKELNGLLAAELNGDPVVEWMDTFMYGFWGEGHTWPFSNNPYPDYPTAEKTWVDMWTAQQEAWTKTPLVTNTQPDASRVGNSEILDRTIRSANWIRTDTIYIENMQIETISNRPPWVAAFSEVAMSDGSPKSLEIHDAITSTDMIISHVLDIGANYWSLWNFNKISAGGIMRYYEQFPKEIDRINRRIGYNVRPSLIWYYETEKHPGLIIGFANDGIAGVPGALRVHIASDDGKVNVGGSLDPGYPLPGKIRQAQFVLPEGARWEGLKLKAELEVKGVRYPLRWACRQKTNSDGSLTLRPNLGLHQGDSQWYMNNS
jgi:hypothetical protein